MRKGIGKYIAIILIFALIMGNVGVNNTVHATTLSEEIEEVQGAVGSGDAEISVENQETASSGNAGANIENEISVIGQSSFGSLLANEFSEEISEQEKNNGYNVFAIEIEDNVAEVSFESLGYATLVVGIYDEVGVQMIASGNTEVSAEETTAVVEIETENMPQYFYVRGFLIDTATYRPLCTVYESPMYTQEMQEFLAKTTADFDADKVLNLDGDITNNFAVFGEKTILIPENSGHNDVITVDNDNNIYVIENADTSITSLQQGNIFSYRYTENDVLIVKVSSISIDGTTATIMGGEASMEEVFDYVKIDAQAGSDEAVVDVSTCAEGVTYEGLVDYVDENTPQIYANSQGSANKAFKLNFDKEFGGIEDINVKISGGLDMKLTFSAKVYFTVDKQYVELRLDYAAKIFASVTGQAKAEIPLVTVGFMFTGIIVEMTPSIVLDAKASISLEGTLSGTIGFRAQVGEGITNLTTVPKFKPSLKIQGSIFFGLSLEPRVKILSEKVASASLNGSVGAELSVASMDHFKSEEDKKHTCIECIAGEINGKFSLTAGLKLVNKWNFDLTILEDKFKILDFYYSLDKDEFGLSTCPYYVYRTKVTVLDAIFDPIQGATVKGATLDKEYMTDDAGQVELWLPVGTHIMLFQKEGFRSSILMPELKDSGKDLYVWLSKADAGGGGMGGRPGESESGGIDDKREMQINTNDTYTAVLTKDGDLYLWGRNQSYAESGGLVDDGMVVDSNVPIKIMNNIKEVNLGREQSAAITDKGELYLWGDNASGLLGDDIATSSSEPIMITDHIREVELSDNNIVVEGMYCAAITEESDLYLWGGNSFYNLGNGTKTGSSEPIKIMNNIKQVSLGSTHSAAITEEGDLYLWGDNFYGQLGNGTTAYSSKPIKILSGVKEVSLKDDYSAAITEEGDLYLWGYNSYGQLGNGTTAHSSEPIKILSGVKTVNLGYSHSAAITEEGDLYLWGKNSSGQLGNGTTINSNEPIKTMSNIKQVSLGYSFSAAITEEGDLYLWGSNYKGQLGNGTTINSSEPIKIMSNVKQVSLGSEFSVATTEEGDLYTWGYNHWGQLGNGTTKDSNTPIKIALPSSTHSVSAFSFKTEETTTSLFLNPQQNWSGTNFTGLCPNEIYNYYIVKSKIADQFAASDNLIYIGQAVSDENGILNVAFTMEETYENADIFAVPMHPMDLSGADVSVLDLAYNGEQQYTSITVTYQGTNLQAGEDYYVEGDYGVTQAGEYTLTVVGTGVYTGTKNVNYKVLTGTCNHVLSKTEAVAPTCGKDGNIEYFTCTKCGKTFADEAGQKEVMDVVLKALGHKPEVEWERDAEIHWKSCSVCGQKVESAVHSFKWIVDKQATEDEDGIGHKECICGDKRNENTVIPKLNHVHTGIVHHNAVAATCIKTGNIEYWTCTAPKCEGKYYGDATCQIALPDIAAVIDSNNHVREGKWTTTKEEHSWICLCGVRTETGVHVYDAETDASCNLCGYQRFYKIISGANGNYEQGSDKDYIIKVDGDFALFESVKIDETILAKADYTVAAGSTVINLKKAYLDTLTVGVHKVEVVYTDGKAAETQINITAMKNETNSSATTEQQESENVESVVPEMTDNGESALSDLKSPKTDQKERTIIWMILIVVIVSGGAVSLLYLKKKRRC